MNSSFIPINEHAGNASAKDHDDIVGDLRTGGSFRSMSPTPACEPFYSAYPTLSPATPMPQYFPSRVVSSHQRRHVNNDTGDKDWQSYSLAPTSCANGGSKSSSSSMSRKVSWSSVESESYPDASIHSGESQEAPSAHLVDRVIMPRKPILKRCGENL